MHEEEKQPQQMPHQVDEGSYKKLFGLDIYLTPVFVISGITIVLFIIGSLIFQDQATELFKNTRIWLTTNLDWLFMITANLVFLFCVIVAISPLGKIRLGGSDAKPEYSNLTWLAMLFAAGVGIGLLFFGVSEPVTYFQGGSYSPLGAETIYDPKTEYTSENVPGINDPDVQPKVQRAASLGIATTVFHWGIHGWAIYGVVGTCISVFRLQPRIPSPHTISVSSDTW